MRALLVTCWALQAPAAAATPPPDTSTPAAQDATGTRPPAASAGAVSTPEQPQDAGPLEHAVSTLYPLWEGSGEVLPHRRAFIGTSSAQFGVLGRLQLGLHPMHLLMRVPNLQLKGALYQGPRLALAAQASAYVVLPGAHDSFFSGRYASAIALRDTTLLALPLTLAASWRAAPWLSLHPSVTALTVTGQAPVATEVTPGTFLSAELRAAARHGFYLHAGQVGLEDGGMQVFGASYRFHTHWFEARAGYLYRRTRDGMQSQPLVSLGALL